MYIRRKRFSYESWFKSLDAVVPSRRTTFAPLLRQIGFSHCIASYNYTKRKASSPSLWSWSPPQRSPRVRSKERSTRTIGGGIKHRFL